MKIDLIPTHDD